jgi:hypothetical protein
MTSFAPTHQHFQHRFLRYSLGDFHAFGKTWTCTPSPEPNANTVCFAGAGVESEGETNAEAEDFSISSEVYANGVWRYFCGRLISPAEVE